MNVWVVTLLGATTLSLVESICWHIKPRKNYDELCKKWWHIGFNYKDNFDAGLRERCIVLINKHCPNMIEIETTMTRKIDEKRHNNEMWMIKVKALLKSDPGTFMSYCNIENNDICTDNFGKDPDCEYWWTVLKDSRVDTEYKLICVKRVTRHCSDMISVLGETKTPGDQRCRRGLSLSTVTYQRPHTGDTASVTQCVRAKS